MIAMLSMMCVVGVFVAGHFFAASTMGAMALLSVCIVGLGCLIAAMELRAVMGQRIENMPLPWTWEKLYLNMARIAIDRDELTGHQPLYVLTNSGPMPVTGLFSARINGEMSFVIDCTEQPVEDANEAFNALKQGVM